MVANTNTNTNTKWYPCDTLKPDNIRDVLVADTFNGEVTLGYYDERTDAWIHSPVISIASPRDFRIQRPVAWCEVPRFDFVAYEISLRDAVRNTSTTSKTTKE